MLHAAATIAVGPADKWRTAAVTCLVSDRPGGRPTHLVTAGHVFPRGATGDEALVWATSGPYVRPVLVGRLAVNLLDAEPAFDAALVALDPGAPWGDAPSAARFDAMGVVPPGGTVRVVPWLPSTAGCSAVTWLSPDDGPAEFRSDVRPEGFTVHSPLRAIPCPTKNGDSGAPLLTAAEPRRAIGLVVGRLGPHAVFQRLPPAMAAFGDRTGWRPYLAHPVTGGRKSASST